MLMFGHVTHWPRPSPFLLGAEMADLFGEESGSESEIDTPDASKPTTKLTNGHGDEEGAGGPDSAIQNGVTSPSSSVNEVTLSDDELPPRYGGGEEEEKGPRDDIKVAVTGYQKAAEDFTFDIEVLEGGAGQGSKLMLSACFTLVRWM